MKDERQEIKMAHGESTFSHVTNVILAVLIFACVICQAVLNEQQKHFFIVANAIFIIVWCNVKIMTAGSISLVRLFEIFKR